MIMGYTNWLLSYSKLSLLHATDPKWKTNDDTADG